MSHEAMEVVLDHVHARARGDDGAVAATLDDGVVHVGVYEHMVCDGREAVLERIRANMRGGHRGIERIELIDAGPEHAVLGLAGPRFREVEAASPDSEVFILFTVQRGRIVRMRDFRSRDSALQAAQET